MRKRLLPLVLGSAALVAGCGSSAADKIDMAKVRSVVTQFAASNGPRACDLLSPDALVNVYGGFKKTPQQAHAACVRQSKRFRGQHVKIVASRVIDPQTVRLSAVSPNGKVSYTVTVQKVGANWRIEQINQAKAEQ